MQCSAAASSSAAEGEGPASSLGPAAGESADAALRRAVLLFPVAVVRLMERLQGTGVGKDLEWLSVLSEKPFKGASDHGSASLGRLVDIFVERHHLLWKVRLRIRRLTETLINIFHQVCLESVRFEGCTCTCTGWLQGLRALKIKCNLQSLSMFLWVRVLDFRPGLLGPLVWVFNQLTG